MDLLILIYGIIGINHNNYLTTKHFSNLKTERANVRFCYNPRMRISKAPDRRMPKNTSKMLLAKSKVFTGSYMAERHLTAVRKGFAGCCEMVYVVLKVLSYKCSKKTSKTCRF